MNSDCILINLFYCMPRKKEMTAIILAGGKSSRMKQDKGLILLQGKMMIEHIIEKAKEVTESIIIITEDPAYLQFGLPCFADTFPGKGPLAGIYSGLLHSSTVKNLVLGCDTPFLSGRILAALRDHCDTEDALVTEHIGKAEVLRTEGRGDTRRVVAVVAVGGEAIEVDRIDAGVVAGGEDRLQAQHHLRLRRLAVTVVGRLANAGDSHSPAQTSLTQARSTQVQALHDYDVTRAKLERAIGVNIMQSNKL